MPREGTHQRGLCWMCRCPGAGGWGMLVPPIPGCLHFNTSSAGLDPQAASGTVPCFAGIPLEGGGMGGAEWAQSPVLGRASLCLAPAAWQRVRVVARDGVGDGVAFGRKGSFILNLFALDPARGHGLLVGCWGDAGGVLE